MFMIDNVIKIKNGIIQEALNIEFDNRVIRFTNRDPQITVLFNRSIRGIKIRIKLNSINSIKYKVSIYYAKKTDNFAEYNVINYLRSYDYSETESIIIFNDYFERVRIDLDDDNTEMDVDKISIEPLYEIPDATEVLKKNFNQTNIKDGVLLFTHDLSSTGAPILALNIAKQMVSLSKNIIMLSCASGNNQLEEEYKNIPLYKLDDFSGLKYFITGYFKQTLYSSNLELQQYAFIEALHKIGYEKALVNSVASGKYVKILKEYDYFILTLIHEMKNTINSYFKNEGMLISQYSDYIVFPDEIVKKDFEALYNKIYGKSMVFPQGVYLDNHINNSQIENVEIIKILQDKQNIKIILGSGTAELRKGTDLFISAAISLAKLDSSFLFVWTGNFYDLDLQNWIQLQIEKSGFKDRILIIPFIKNKNDYKKLLSNVDAFWLTSREDPFPSVALEAMNFGIPVFGFENSGGFNTMSERNKAISIKGYDTSQLAKTTFDYFLNPTATGKIDENEVKLFLSSLSFGNYVEKLNEILKWNKVIEPDLNLYLYQNCSKKHYFDLQLPTKELKHKTEVLSKARFKKSKLSLSKIILLDTKIGSDNIGDDIIMSYCEQICNEVFIGKELVHVPTHIYDRKSEQMQDKIKILCGTNILYKEMENSKQLSFPEDMSNMKNVCLLGVGMQEIGLEKKPSEYTIKLLKFMLKNKFLHSVRDKQTKQFLEEIGIKNVVYTSCPTLWNLTPEHCKRINKKKCNNVLTTITDYKTDKDNDTFMLNTLQNEYDKVYIWIQGQLDYEYLQQIVNTKKFILVPPTLDALDEILKIEDLDYVGTRLHAGIRSLNKLHRSLIISIDNRAREMAKDTNIPVIGRTELKDRLVEWINSDHETNINLPENEIEMWKKQFNR